MALCGGGVKLTLLILISIYFAPGLPPHFNFISFSLPNAAPLEGLLAPNNILDHAKPIKVDSPIAGPESIAFRGNELFTGLLDGRLVSIKNGKVKEIGNFGKNCGGDSPNDRCGRIAGVRFDSDGKLLCADAVHGIWKVDVDTGISEKLVSMDVEIDGLLPRFPDDLDVDKNGNIYFSDASTISGIDDLALEALAGPTGRLVKYNPKTKENTVLINNMHFPNAVQLSPTHDFVLVTETFGSRVWRYYLKGKNQGQKDIFVDNLPGLPDNIRPSNRGGYYIVASPRIHNETTPIEVIGNWPLTRRFVVRLYYFLLKGLAQVDTFFPSAVLKDWIGWVKRFGPLGDLDQVPFKTIIVETDADGKVVGSLQNDKGPVRKSDKIRAICRLSEISVGKEWTYFGSPGLKELYRIKTNDLSN